MVNTQLFFKAFLFCVLLFSASIWLPWSRRRMIELDHRLRRQQQFLLAHLRLQLQWRLSLLLRRRRQQKPTSSKVSVCSGKAKWEVVLSMSLIVSHRPDQATGQKQKATGWHPALAGKTWKTDFFPPRNCSRFTSPDQAMCRLPEALRPGDSPSSPTTEVRGLGFRLTFSSHISFFIVINTIAVPPFPHFVIKHIAVPFVYKFTNDYHDSCPSLTLLCSANSGRTTYLEHISS